MRRLLNTLYITTPEAYLAKEGQNILVRVDDEVKFRIPVHNLEGIICFGYSGASPAAMELCCESGVALTFLTAHGRFLGRVTGKVSGNVLLRRQQYRMADDVKESARIASRIIGAKIVNCRTVLRRAISDHAGSIDREAVAAGVDDMSRALRHLAAATSLDQVRGIEGEAAHIYFACFDHLIVAQKEHFSLNGRVRRPPTDNTNALLSFIYTLLAHDIGAALEAVGLDPQVGYLHRDRPGRLGLALDLMEEFRPYLADRLVLSLINRKQITEKGFRKKESGAVIMEDDTRKAVLTAWQKRKQEEVNHPFLSEKIPVGLLPYSQAMLLARHLRGDLDDYPPFFWK